MHATFISYVSGFVLSILLTLTAYLFVSLHVNSEHFRFSHHLLIPLIGGLAIVQFIVQAIFFLHLGRESKPRWKLLVFLGMIGVVIILVFGSIWIMNNLNYHMMSPAELRVHMHAEEGL
jgi:cytochrome o ubiquinol oxidase operon protein cyoD